MELTPGRRLRSARDATEIIVVRAPGGELDLRCGGAPMLPHQATAPAANPDPAYAGGSAMGKRYVNEDGTLEVLCTKPGDGQLSIGEVSLTTKDAKPLPSSD